MSKAALEREFRRELDSQLRTLGFERCRITWLYRAYFRRIAGVQHVLGIRIEPYFDDLEAEIVSVSVRLNDVEDLVARFEEPHPLVGPEDVAMRCSLAAQIPSNEPEAGDPLRGWGGENRKLWLIRSAGEVPSIASEIVACVSKECCNGSRSSPRMFSR